VRGRLLAAALGLVVLGALLARGTGRGAAWAPFPSVPSRRMAAPPSSLPGPAATPWAPSRDLFRYADERAAGPAPSPPAVTAPRAEALPVSPPAAVRVVGLIRRGGQLKAALVVHGEMTVAGAGERAGRYTVVTVDEETGVRLRGPDGDETVLPPPSF